MKLSDKIVRAVVISALACLCTNSCFAQISTEAKLEYNKGVEFYQHAQYDSAVDRFRKAVDLDPNYIDAYFNLGSLLEYLQDDEGALNAFKQIILRKPDDYEAVCKAAELSFRLGDIEKAKMFLTLVPQDSMYGAEAKGLMQKIETKIADDKKSAETAEEEQKTPPQNTTFAASNGVYENITSPTGVTTDNVGNLYVAGFSDNTIYKIDANNNKIVYIKDTSIDGPIGIVRDEDGNLYVANYNKNNVLKIDTGGKITELIKDLPNPYCMHITDGLLFVSSQGSNSVIRYKLNQ